MTFVGEAFGLGKGALLPGLGLAPGVPAPAPVPVPAPFPRSFLSLYPLVFCDLDAARARPIAASCVGRMGARAGAGASVDVGPGVVPDVSDSVDAGDVDAEGCFCCGCGCGCNCGCNCC